MKREFEEFYRMYYEVVAKFIFRQTEDSDVTEDMVQEIFCLAYEKWPKLSDHPCREGWLLQVAKFKLLEFWRKMERQDVLSVEEELPEPGVVDENYGMVEIEAVAEANLKMEEWNLMRSYYLEDKNVQLVTKHKIFTEAEFLARYAIYTESYNKIVAIEARTMVDMAMHQILPAALRYTKSLCDTLSLKQSLGIPSHAESVLIRHLSQNTDSLYDALDTLRHTLAAVPRNAEAAARYYHDTIIPGMNAIRSAADALEILTDKACWPYPTYSDLLFY